MISDFIQQNKKILDSSVLKCLPFKFVLGFFCIFKNHLMNISSQSF